MTECRKLKIQLVVFISFIHSYYCHGLMMARVQGRNLLPLNKIVHKVLSVMAGSADYGCYVNGIIS